MKARILPRDEWSKLERSPHPPFPGVRPDDIAVVVVENDDKVVACMTVLRATHFEGVWIDPEHRNAGVTRALLKQAVAAAGKWTDGWVLAGASDDQMHDVLSRMRGVRVPMDSYALAIGGY